MTRGASGRVVVEVDPELKRRLHAAVALRGETLKDWFLRCVQELLKEDHASLAAPTNVKASRQPKEKRR